MARIYTDEEKKEYIEMFRKSEQSIPKFATANNVPVSTFRKWLKNDTTITFGAINIEPQGKSHNQNSICFSSEFINIELKKGFDKKFLKKLLEVLIDD